MAVARARQQNGPHSRKRAEAFGYATFAVAEHFATQYAPMQLLQYAADQTSRIQLATLVLDNDFRHPAVLAKEAATLDVLSGGRLELELGARWLLQEYRQAGIAFQDGPGGGGRYSSRLTSAAPRCSRPCRSRRSQDGWACRSAAIVRRILAR